MNSLSCNLVWISFSGVIVNVMILFNAPQLVQIDEALVDSVLAERHLVGELHVFLSIVAQLHVARLL